MATDVGVQLSILRSMFYTIGNSEYIVISMLHLNKKNICEKREIALMIGQSGIIIIRKVSLILVISS